MLSHPERLLRWMLCLCAAYGVAPAAGADEVVLTTGITKVGVIESETDEMVRLRTEVGTTGISREFIVEVRHATPEENAALQQQWAAATEAAKRERQEQAEAERAFAEQQRQKGLVLYEGDWLTKQEADLRLQARRDELAAENDRRTAAAEADRERAERELARVKEQMADLQAELDACDATIDDLEHQLRAQEYELIKVRDQWGDALQRWRTCRNALAACRNATTP